MALLGTRGRRDASPESAAPLSGASSASSGALGRLRGSCCAQSGNWMAWDISRIRGAVLLGGIFQMENNNNISGIESRISVSFALVLLITTS